MPDPAVLVLAAAAGLVVVAGAVVLIIRSVRRGEFHVRFDVTSRDPDDDKKG